MRTPLSISAATNCSVYGCRQPTPCDVQPLCDLAHRLGMVVYDGLLEPQVAEIFQHPPDPDRGAEIE